MDSPLPHFESVHIYAQNTLLIVLQLHVFVKHQFALILRLPALMAQLNIFVRHLLDGKVNMAYKTKFSIFRLVKDYEKARGKNVKQDELAELIGIDSRTVNALMLGTLKRADLVTLDKLLEFFRREGMPITVADLFVVEDDSAKG